MKRRLIALILYSSLCCMGTQAQFDFKEDVEKDMRAAIEEDDRFYDRLVKNGSSNSIKAYREYIFKFGKNGRHIEKVKSKIAELEEAKLWEEAKDAKNDRCTYKIPV